MGDEQISHENDLWLLFRYLVEEKDAEIKEGKELWEIGQEKIY